MKTDAIDFLTNCVRTGAFRSGDFTLKSGRKSKYFFNLGDGMKDGEGVAATRDAYINQLMEMDFEKKYSDAIESVFLFGPAYKGIPLAGVVALDLYEGYDLNVRWGYDRKELKDHGAGVGKWLVGDLRDGDTVIILDDVITTSATKREAWENLNNARQGLKHGGIVIALDRQEVDADGKSPILNLEKEGIEVSSILLAREVFDYLHNRKIHDKVVVDDEVYADFQKHQEKFGINE